jgi:hypothetical protein
MISPSEASRWKVAVEAVRTETGMIMLRNCGKIIERRRKTVSMESPLLTRRFMMRSACCVRRRITRTRRLRKKGVRSSRKRYR